MLPPGGVFEAPRKIIITITIMGIMPIMLVITAMLAMVVTGIIIGVIPGPLVCILAPAHRYDQLEQFQNQCTAGFFAPVPVTC